MRTTSDYQSNLFEPSIEDLREEWNKMAQQCGVRGCFRINNEMRTRFDKLVADPVWAANWRVALAKIPKCPELLGHNRWLKGGRPFKAHLRWFLNDETVFRLLEGFYQEENPNRFVGNRLKGDAF